jgi:hypothetical protein
MTKKEIRTAKDIEAAKPKYPKRAQANLRREIPLEEERRRREIANLAYAWLDGRGIDWDSGGHYSAVLPGLSYIGLEWVYRVGDAVQLKEAAGSPAEKGSITRCHEDGRYCDIKFASGEEQKEVPVSQ